MNVILFSNNCPKCKVLKSKLQEANIEFEEVNDVELMLKKGFVSVPVLEVDGVVHSFKEAIKWIGE